MRKGWYEFKKFMAGLMVSSLFVFSLSGCGSASEGGTNGSSESPSSAGSQASEGTSEDTKQTLTTINEAIMTGQFDYYTTIIGQWQGIFEQHGIDLQTTEYAVGINTIDAIVNGTATIGMMANYAAVNRLGNTLHDTDLVLFSEMGGGGSNQNGGLYVAPEYIDNLDALDGSKGFITTIGTVYDYYAWKCMEYLNLDPDKQNLVNTDSNATALAVVLNNEASAYYTTGSQAEKVEEYGWKLAFPATELNLITGAYFLTTQEYYEENQDLLVEWMRAVQESFDYISSNLDECGDYLAENYGVDKDVFISNYQSVISKVGFSQEGADALVEMEQWCYEHGRFEEDFDITQFIRTEVAEKAIPEQTTYTR